MKEGRRKGGRGKITGDRGGGKKRNQPLSEMMVAFAYSVPEGIHFLIIGQLSQRPGQHYPLRENKLTGACYVLI